MGAAQEGIGRMNISEASNVTGLPPKTIRYYEDIALVRPQRSGNGYRVFSEHDVHNLRFLGHARALGFSIEDCRALLALYEDKNRASKDVRAIAAQHLSQIAKKIAALQDMHDTLSDLVENCAGDARPDCPILKGMAR